MTAVTVTTNPEGVLDIDYKVLTVTDGYTYVSKLSKPYGAIMTVAETTTNWAGSAMTLDYALSSRTFTIRWKIGTAAVSSKKLSFMAYGRK
jgi:hypothetical protein